METAPNRPKTVEELLKITDQPVVAIDDHGQFTYINDVFTQAYGWTESDLLGKPVTMIMPPDMRPAHERGIGRFLETERIVVAGKPAVLPVLYKNGNIEDSEHFILGEKRQGIWRFAATIALPETQAPDLSRLK